MPTTLTNGIQLPDKGSVDWYSSMQSNYNLIDTHLGDTDIHVTAEDKIRWDSNQGSLSQDQLDAIAQVATNTDDIATLQSDKADASHTHSSSDITDIDDYATKDYVDTSISDLVDNAPDALNTLNELSAALNDDSNFATTVTNALANKADSADLATVATSGSYTDLTDKPTIPTNTSDLTNDSDFVVSSNLATIATSGDYDDLSNKPSIPTNTSDLNNDSGFVTLNDFDIPAKTSDLTNDSGFITINDVPVVTVPERTSDLTNDSGFITSDDLPDITVPTNTSDLNNDSGFITSDDLDIPTKTSDLTNDSGFITSSDVPTSTSDLINDSNFVDTSNSAVASGITSAKVTDYDSHIADTDIHVTTADKDKWNNGVSQAFVFRYSSTALVASSTNSNTLLDNTDNLKVGDKVIDSSGVIYSVTAIDTANSTFTIGTSLIDLAQDSDVVHKSGTETIGGNKTLTGIPEILRKSGDHKLKITDTRVTPLNPTESITSNITWQDSTGRLIGTVANVYDSSGNSIMQLYARSFNANDEYESHKLRLISNKGGNSFADIDVDFVCSADNKRCLGTPSLRWKDVYSVNYYYGNDNVEFSDKFVTTDTAQTINGDKTFEGQLKLNAYSWVIRYKTQGTSNYPNYNTFKQIEYNKYNNIITLRRSSDVLNSGDNFNVVDTSFAFYKIHVKSKYVDLVDNTRFLNDGTNSYVVPLTDNATFFGSSSNKWKDVQTYQINSLEPSSLSLPSDRSARIDISSYFTNTGTGQSNNYTVPANGYIYLTLSELTIIHCFSRTSGNVINYAQTFTKLSNSPGVLYVLFPVRKNDVFVATWYTSTTVSVDGAYFIPCQGNV